MRKPRQRPRQATTQQAQPRTKRQKPQIALGRRNYVIMGVGLATIITGFVTLANGSMTLAPLLLVVGYCVLIPVSLLVK